MLDIVLLRILKHKSEYIKLYQSVPSTAVDPKTKALLDDFGKYFSKFPDHEVVKLDVFTPRFRQWHPGLTEEQYNIYKGVLRQIDEDVDESTRAGVLADLYELTMATAVGNYINKYQEGDLKEPLANILSDAIDTYKINNGISITKWNDQTIEDLIQEDIVQPGLRWRLNCLNEHMRPLRGGDFGIVAGRPDKGKTTFLTSEVTHFAKQMPEEKNILWLNNEGPSSRIKKRLYVSAFGLTWTRILEMHQENKPVMDAYAKVVGRRDRIRILDIHGWHTGQVEAAIEHNNPGVVIFDMIDKIKGFGSEARTDLQLESMYDWARERCVKYDFVGLATSQISVEGNNEQYPGLSMLKDSKTGKQGACDFQLMIGAVDDKNLIYSRYIGLPKNKLRLDSAPGAMQEEVVFKPTVGRYEDIPHDAT